MRKLLEKVDIFVLVVSGLLYIAAKIHFFTRYWALGLGGYLEEHWFLWAAMAIMGAIATGLRLIRNHLERANSN